ncbi:MAG: RNA-binding protein [Myxococcota bacterium]
MASKLFVGSLNPDFGLVELIALFKPFGEILEADVFVDPNTGRSRCFGFVTIASHKDAKTAVHALDGTMQLGSRIHVE